MSSTAIALRAFVLGACLLFAPALTAKIAPQFLFGSVAMADDDDGGDDDGGGGGAGAGRGGGGGAGRGGGRGGRGGGVGGRGDGAATFFRSKRYYRRGYKRRSSYRSRRAKRSYAAPRVKKRRQVAQAAPRRSKLRQVAQAPVRIRQRPEIVAAGLDDTQLASLLRRGFELRGDVPNSILGARLTRLAVPPRRGARSSLRIAREAVPQIRFARNNLYEGAPRWAFRTTGRTCGGSCASFDVTAWSSGIASCSSGAAIGMIDTGVDEKHPALANADIEEAMLARTDRDPAGDAHGTAVASLMVGAQASQVHGVAPGAKLFAANAFHRNNADEQADTFDLITALEWLAERKVSVINMSLTGPDNDLLKDAIAKVVARGITVVAAVGEPGRSTGYPGRYDGVIAVSSIDHRMRASRRAARGDHVMFSAPGVGLVVAAEKGSIRRVDGSSFAAPFVSAAYAVGIRQGASEALLTDRFAGTARDLGRKGRDPVYGWGVLQYSALSTCSTLQPGGSARRVE